MSKQRTGNFIAGGNPQVPSLTLNNGVFDSNEVYTAVNNNAWQPSGSGTYELARSLRFRASAITTLTKTFSTTGTGNTQRFTYAFWVKKGLHNANMQLFSSAGPNHSGGADISTIVFNSDEIQFYHYPNGGSGYWLVKSHALRDHSAWYHVVLSCDTTLASASQRARIWINGVEHIKTDNVYPNQNGTTYYFSTRQQMWGQEDVRTRYPFDGYLAELHAIDGQALDQTYFGYFDNLGIWQPKRYAGSYGTNGYYFAFTDNQTTLNLGRNFAGSNLIQYSQTLDQTGAGAWAGGAASVSANSATAPDGTTTADKVVENSVANSQHYLLGNGNPTTSSFQNCRLTLSVYAKAAGRNFFQLALTDSVIAATGVVFDLANGLLCERSGDSTAFTNTQGTITAVGNGWYRCTMTTTKGSLNGNAQPVFYLASGTTAGSTNYNGDGTSGVLFWGAQLNFGETADNYIATTSSAANTNWNVNNFILTAGSSAYDSMVDSPTNIFTTATDTGGIVSGNYATLNPLYKGYGGYTAASTTITNANLNQLGNASGNNCAATIAIPTSGKWYYEMTVGATGNGSFFPGIINEAGSVRYYENTGTYYNGTSSVAYGASYTLDNTIGVAVDADTLTLTFYKNGVSQGNISNAFTSTSTWFPWFYTSSNSSIAINFGQRPFIYAPPTGFKSLNTTNLQALGATVTARAGLEPSKWFDVVLSAGNTTGRTVSGLKFQPDLVVFKNRDGAGNRRWSWFDSIRGPNNHLSSQLTDAEFTGRSDLLTAFNSDGFSVGADAAYYGANGFNERWAQWIWKAGDTTVTNTSGSVSTQVKVSATSGFSIATYTPPSSGSFTFGHGLGSTPKFFLLKERTATSNWIVWHPYWGSPTNTGAYFNSYINFAAGANWLTGVTSTTIGITQGQVTSGAVPHVVYSFVDVPGFSKFGTYVGNGSTDGTFVYTGFRPKWIMVRAASNTTTSTWWTIWDTSRSQANPALLELYPNSSNAEGTDSSGADILSNGFKPKRNSEYANFSGWTYIYAAFAESPFALNNRAR